MVLYAKQIKRLVLTVVYARRRGRTTPYIVMRGRSTCFTRKNLKKVVCYNTRLPTTILPRFTGKVRE